MNVSRLVFFNDTATTEIYTLSLHDALPISITLTGVTDAVSNGGNCSITSGNPNGTIAPLGTATLGYQCLYGAVPVDGTNTTTAKHNSEPASHSDVSCPLLAANNLPTALTLH